MKSTFQSFSMLPVAGLIYGQAREGSVGYHKRPQPAAVLELPYAPDDVNAALNFLSKKSKSRRNNVKGFTTFRITEPAAKHNLTGDLYLKVEPKSKHEKEFSTVSLLLARPDKGLTTAIDSYSFNMEQTKVCLNELVLSIHAYHLELQKKNQNKAVKKAESKYKRLTGDGDNLEKKRMSIEKKIRDNQLEKDMQLIRVDSQKQKLEVFSGQ